MPAPGIQQLAGRVGIGVDDGAGGADALQPHRLPHNQHLGVRSRRVNIGSGGRSTRSRGVQSAVVQVGSTMIRSPGAAASIALWIVPEAATWVGVLPPMVTVTASTDCFPLPAVITNWPHCAARAAILRLLLDGAGGHAGGHSHCNRCVAPTRNGCGNAADRNARHGIASRAGRAWRRARRPKPIVAA